MKKIIVVSKTHLDLGFTDYSENIKEKYINSFIPSAIELAGKVNTENKKNFIWTTGSWIIKEALETPDKNQKLKLIKALENGDIVAHALPFTMHSEVLDKDTFEYGMSIVKKLDKISGRKTVAAKMTDVPGHTKAIVPILAKHGIKLLHIGVNGASAIPEVPECFLWKCDGEEIVVIYSGTYGGAFKSEFCEEILYFDHTLDNHGAPSPEKVLKKLDSIQKQYPGYTVSAGTLDEFAEIIWENRTKLPVYEGEIGDSWIHGSASDPFKSAALRELMMLKRKWISDGTMSKESEEYTDFSDALLCIGEHTCGMNSMICFADFENYLKSDFQKAREKDIVKIKHPLRGFPLNLLTVINRCSGRYKKSSYKVIEKSWIEQRGYLDKALSALTEDHRKEAENALAKLKPELKIENTGYKADAVSVKFNGYELEINEFGGIGHLCHNGNEIIRHNNEAVIEYRSYSKKDYDFWFDNYSRDIEKHFSWAYTDFGRPLLKYAENKYPTGRFFYKTESTYINENENGISVIVNLKCAHELCQQLGAPRIIQLVYTLNSDGLSFDVSWYGKDASRLTEVLFLHLYPYGDDLKIIKLDSEVDYRNVASMGGRNLHAAEKCVLKTDAGSFDFVNTHAPLVSIGKGKILEYDNRIESIDKDGIAYVLYNNVWGTNFPLWYEENAYFNFKIQVSK